MPVETDRERIIRAIECCISDPDGKRACDKCPYGEAQANGRHCQNLMHNDALNLLKERNPEVEVLNEIDRLYKCPECHKAFFYQKQRFCDRCGKAVKWE